MSGGNAHQLGLSSAQFLEIDNGLSQPSQSQATLSDDEDEDFMNGDNIRKNKDDDFEVEDEAKFKLQLVNNDVDDDEAITSRDTMTVQ